MDQSIRTPHCVSAYTMKTLTIAIAKSAGSIYKKLLAGDPFAFCVKELKLMLNELDYISAWVEVYASTDEKMVAYIKIAQDEIDLCFQVNNPPEPICD